MKEDPDRALLPRGKALCFPALRRLWRGLLALRLRILLRRRQERTVLEHPAGLPLLVLPGVFNPVRLRTGEFLARELAKGRIPPGASVLDLGCGSGVGTVAAIGAAARVVAADINPAAVRCARLNALLHRVEDRVEAIESDLFSALEGRRFDVVLFNPPFFRGAPRDAQDQAWRAEDTLERFAAELADHLAPGGFALVVFSTDGDLAGLLAAFRAHALEVEIAAERDLVNEILVLYRVRPGAAKGKGSAE